MNYNKAKKILEINDDNFTLKDLKNKYYKLALLYHPDKCIEDNSNEKFQDITLAYNYMKNFVNNPNFDSKNNFNDLYTDEINLFNTSNNSNSFIYLITKFLISLNYDIDISENELNNILENIDERYFHFIKKILNTLDYDVKQNIYIFLIKKKISKNNLIMKLFFEILEDIKINKYNINVTIDNLLNDEICKLNINDLEIFIPLWHDELQYEINGELLYITCTHPTSDDYFIDEENNIFVKKSIEIKEILNNSNYNFKIGSKEFIIEGKDISIKKNQIIVIKNAGIPIINYQKIYEIDKRSNIYINLTLY